VAPLLGRRSTRHHATFFYHIAEQLSLARCNSFAHDEQSGAVHSFLRKVGLPFEVRAFVDFAVLSEGAFSRLQATPRATTRHSPLREKVSSD